LQSTVVQLATPRLTYLDFIAGELMDIVILDIAYEFFANVHTFSRRLFEEQQM
jgi:hypothetical protein